MKFHRFEKGVAGLILLISLILAVGVSHWWLILTFLVSINIFQSAFTDKCPLKWIVNKVGIKIENG
ncbi:MAG: DUF2892 domain-containing protein [Candidatus Korarchaeota archaeon]|nr:DUF2892 domain-containing protein [Candidatus Korarchaeota archaeon]